MKIRTLLSVSGIVGIVMVVLFAGAIAATSSTTPTGVTSFGKTGLMTFCASPVWFLICGAFSAWLYRRLSGSVILKSGAVAGAMSALIGYIIFVIASIIMVVRIIAVSDKVSLIAAIQNLTVEKSSVLGVVIYFFVWILCSSVGGFLGALMFRRQRTLADTNTLSSATNTENGERSV